MAPGVPTAGKVPSMVGTLLLQSGRLLKAPECPWCPRALFITHRYPRRVSASSHHRRWQSELVYRKVKGRTPVIPIAPIVRPIIAPMVRPIIAIAPIVRPIIAVSASVTTIVVVSIVSSSSLGWGREQGKSAHERCHQNRKGTCFHTSLNTHAVLKYSKILRFF